MAFRSCKPFNSKPNTNNQSASKVFLLMLAWVLLITLSPPLVGCIPAGTKPGIMCKNIERQALLTLKAGLVDKAGRLSSWSVDNPNCCHWKGVTCSNHTGHVFKLNLRNPFEEDEYDIEDNNFEYVHDDPEDDKYIQYRLEGEISSYLLELKYLEYLDLSLNFFNYTKVPPFLGSLEELRYLNLSSSSFSGVVPPSLGNLSRLEYLDLGNNYNGSSGQGLEVGSWQWLTGMSSLTYLNLEGVYLSKEKESDWWGEVLNKLPNLLELHLSNCGLSNLPMSINHHPINFTSSLSILDLSYNYGLEVGSWQWLTGMSSLKYLNLDSVDLSKAQESGWLGEVFNKLPMLMGLYLSGCGLSIPMSISHHPMNFTSSLSILDLSRNNFSSSLSMPPWLFNLTGLVDLQLSGCSLGAPFNIPHEIGRLVALQQLDLSFNGIGGQLPASLGNLTNLVTLNLENNKLEGRIPVTFGHLCKLRELNLRENKLEGDINEFIDGLATCSSDHLHLETLDLSSNKLLGTLPSSLGSFSNLISLDLSYNSFWGSIPTTIGSLTALRYLDLTSNKMNGTIAETIGKLQELEKLDLSGNQWRGQMLNEAHFEKLTKLRHLDLSSTSKKAEGNLLLVMNVTQDWLPPFRRSLYELRLYGVKMSSKMFPRWTQTLHELEYLILADSGIADSIPTEFWKSFPHITELDLSNNAISIPTTFNNMGRLVHAAGKLQALDLANNSFGNGGGGGEIPSNIGQLFPSLQYLDLSSNSLSGAIPRSISQLQSLRDLSLGNNMLTGELTHLHWENLTSLFTIDLSNNRLVGKIPQSLGHLAHLDFLLLNDNSLEGEIPTFPTLMELQVLDLGGNKLSGNIPPTLASHNPGLLVFRLRGNMLSGTIPLELCLLSQLQTLDLAHNNFTGTIPWCLGNLSTTDTDQYFPDGITLVVKGREYKYDAGILSLVHLVDLSHNNLSGTIPKSLMNLTAMQTLNLSMNHLTGEIPSNIGLLHDLESLDLSQNHLSGPIPLSISDISSLNYLNLSHNDLSGRIPLSRQLQTLDTNSSSYDGNPLLCGLPLPTTCPGDGTPNGYQEEGEENVGHAKRKFDIEEWGFVLSIVLGFVVGFWGVCGSLVLKPSWRQAYFGYLVGIKEKIIVVVVLNVARFRRKIGISE